MWYLPGLYRRLGHTTKNLQVGHLWGGLIPARSDGYIAKTAARVEPNPTVVFDRSQQSPATGAAPPNTRRSAKRPRPCENMRVPRNRRIVFSIAFFGQPPPTFLVFRLTKLRRTFYAQIERASFRTAWTLSGHSAFSAGTTLLAAKPSSTAGSRSGGVCS